MSTVIGIILLIICTLAIGFLMGAIWAGIRRDDDPPFDPFIDSRVELVRREENPGGEWFIVTGQGVSGCDAVLEIAYANWLRAKLYARRA